MEFQVTNPGAFLFGTYHQLSNGDVGVSSAEGIETDFHPAGMKRRVLNRAKRDLYLLRLRRQRQACQQAAKQLMRETRP